MDVGFKYRKSGKLPKVKVPGTFYYLYKGGDKDELWFCFRDTLIKRIDNELLNADEVNAVIKEYLEKNGISLDGYATEKWVEDVLKKYATKTDLGGYTTKKELETKLGDYATKTDVKTELDAYATKESVEKLKTDIESNYATKTDIPTKLSELDNDSGYIKQAGLEKTLEDYVKKDDAAKKSVWEELTFID